MARGEEQADRAAFERAVGTAFVVHLHPERSVTLTLREVASHPAPAGWESFSLVFEGPDPPPFSHATYAVEHDEIGALSLFLGPVQTTGPGRHYEAVFNRRTP